MTRRDWAGAALVSIVVGFLLGLQALTLTSATAPPWLEAPLVFATPESRAEAMVARMDGHFAAEIAADPTLARTRRDFAADPADGAYRATRPVMGWSAWLLSGGGRRPAIAPALFLLTALSAGALTLATSALGRAYDGGAPRAWLVNLAPGAAIATIAPGLTECLATALALTGLALHWRGRTTMAIALWVAAVLTRETTILIPAAVALADLLASRRLRSIALAAVPAAAYIAWNLVVRALLGESASGGGANQIGPPAFGLIAALPGWHLLEVVTAIVTVGAAVVLWRTGNRHLRAITIVNVVFLSLMGRVVWADWWAFGRLALPLVALAVATTSTNAQPAGSRWSPRTSHQADAAAATTSTR